MNALWTLPELTGQVAAALSGAATGRVNARVREVPDARTVRWYQTTGLVDRPATLRGRTALYGRRHLLQLVAIKRLQAQGRSLSEIQAELAGLSTPALENLAQLPLGTQDSDAGGGTDGGHAEAPPERAIRLRFWTAQAAQSPTVQTSADGANQAPRPTSAAPVHGVRLDDRALLVLSDGARAPQAADLPAIEAAAAPLLAELDRLGLLPTAPPGPKQSPGPGTVPGQGTDPGPVTVTGPAPNPGPDSPTTKEPA